ncbi:hypothetical protein [Streptomyces canus]|uniref:hypothetical protein n=1 Tax=Streptomyces canus TaxID=58343 RepID=UPI0022559DEC|nr:hypothetical protein [Streptomyces canus]
MLTDTVLPGFPPLDTQKGCLDCDELLFSSSDNWTSYTKEEFDAWERSLPDSGVSSTAKFRDSKGNVGNHAPRCRYRELPPIALWQEDPEIAERIRAKLLHAKGLPVD